MPDITVLVKPASGLCNMRCRYCFYYGLPEHNNGIMTDETLETLVKRIFEYASDKPSDINIAWQGGEPTLAGEEYFRKAVELTKSLNTAKHRIHYSIQTNGYELSEGLADLFARENFLVGISLDANREIHDMNRVDAAGKGTYDRVMKTVKLLRSKGVDFNILCVISKAVARNPAKVYNSLTRAGFDFLQFIPCFDDGQTGAHSIDSKLLGNFFCRLFDLWFDDIEKGKQISIRDFDNYVMRAAGRLTEICTMRGVCGCYFTVEADGNVYPCDFYVSPEWKMGNLADKSLFELQGSETAKRFIEESKLHPDECKNCRWYGFCGSGCRRLRNGVGVNNFCEAYKMLFEHAHERIFYLARKFFS